MSCLLKPVYTIDVEIHLNIDKHSWLEFMKELTQDHESLPSPEFYIQHIKINLDYYNYKHRAYPEVVQALKYLSCFKVRSVTVENWYVTEQMFKILAETKDKFMLDLEYLNWAFSKIDSETKLEYRIGRYINLQFKNWKYTESKDKTSKRFSLQDITDASFVNFMVDFINIRHLAKKINSLSIEGWFEINKHTIK